MFNHGSHEKRQAEPDNQQLFTPSQPKHSTNICHSTALSSHQPPRGNASAGRRIGVSAFAKRHQLRRAPPGHYRRVGKQVYFPGRRIRTYANPPTRRYVSPRRRLRALRPRTRSRGLDPRIPLIFPTVPSVRHSLVQRRSSADRSLSWHSPCNRDFGNP